MGKDVIIACDFSCKNIIEELPVVMEQLKIERLEDIIGGCH